MKSIVCYGDSNVWGFIPGGGRHSWSVRWPGKLSAYLGIEYRVIEEGLNGRNSGVDDLLFYGRNGMDYLPIILETHYPADMLIIMLGTNDMKLRFNRSASDIALSIKKLIEFAQTFDSNVPEIILISPPKIITSYNINMNENFEGAIDKSTSLSSEYRSIAELCDCHFIDASESCQSSIEDGIHMDSDNHLVLADLVFKKIQEISIV